MPTYQLDIFSHHCPFHNYYPSLITTLLSTWPTITINAHFIIQLCYPVHTPPKGRDSADSITPVISCQNNSSHTPPKPISSSDVRTCLLYLASSAVTAPCCQISRHTTCSLPTNLPLDHLLSTSYIIIILIPTNQPTNSLGVVWKDAQLYKD